MDNYNQIVLLIELGKFEAAIKKVHELMADNSDNPKLHYALSFCYANLEIYDKAIQYVEKALALDAQYIDALNLFAEIEIGLENYGHSLRLLNQSIKVDPEQYEVFDLKTRLYFEQSRMTEALESANKSLEINPDGILPKNIITYDLLMKRQFDEANELIDELMYIDPENSFTQINFSILKINKHETEESKELLQYALSKDPENEVIQNILKLAIISKNPICYIFIKIDLIKNAYAKQFRLIILIVYRLLTIGFVIHFFIKNGHFLDLPSLLVIVILSFYNILLITFRIPKQLIKISLLFDEVGKYLINTKDKYLIGCTLILLAAGIFILLHNYINETLDNYILILGLYCVYLSGYASITEEMNVKHFFMTLSLYMLGGTLFIPLYMYLPELRRLFVFLILLQVLLLPLVLRAFREKV